MHEREPSVSPLWDAAVVLCITVAAVQVPLQLLRGETDAQDWMAWTITLFFAVDLLVRFFVALPRHGGSRPVGGRSTYLWLALDAVAAAPYHLLGAFPGLTLFRLLKLGRVSRLMRQLRRRQLRHYNQLGLIFFSYWLLLSVHWIACGWVALHSSASGGADTAYLDALYWTLSTLTTVGYGDVTPANSAQKLYAMGVMIVGIGAYGFIVANLATLLANIDPARRSYSRSMERLSSFMYYRNIPPPLQQRIRDYYEYVWEKRLDYDESAILSTLPPSLAVEVSMYLKREIIERVPLFSGASDEFIREIALQLQPVVFTPGDCIVRRGERGSNMYFISRGVVEILGADDRSVIATLGDGDFFGEIALFLNQPRTATARAVDYCDLYVLDKEMFDRVIAHFPEVGGQIREKANVRFRRLGADLHDPHAEGTTGSETEQPGL